MTLNNEACQDLQHFLAFPVLQDSPAWTESNDSFWQTPSKVENFGLRLGRKDSSKNFWRKTTLKIEKCPNYKNF